MFSVVLRIIFSKINLFERVIKFYSITNGKHPILNIFIY